MTLTAKEDTALVAVSSPVAGVAQVHEMKMEGDVMRMQAVPSLALPAGKPVSLRPSNYHVMLMDLKLALKPDSTIPLTLFFKNAQGVSSRLDIKVPVYLTAPSGQAHGNAMPAHPMAAFVATGADSEQVVMAMKHQFERADAPLTVQPVTVLGAHGVAGWLQGAKDGRALLQKNEKDLSPAQTKQLASFDGHIQIGRTQDPATVDQMH